MLTPPGYQNRQNNKQKRTFCTHLKLKKKIIFRISLRLYKIIQVSAAIRIRVVKYLPQFAVSNNFDNCLLHQNNTSLMEKLVANKTRIINAISRQ